MARIVRLLLVALVLFATWQAAVAQWHNFKLEDAVKQLATFGVDQDGDVTRAAVLAEGLNQGITLAPEQVIVNRIADHVYIQVEYTRPIQLLPGYTYRWTFRINAEGYFVPGGRIQK